MNPKIGKPALRDAQNGPWKSDPLAREISFTNKPNTAPPQAPLLADTAGESDYLFFARRPHLSSRKWLAFEGEGYDSAAFVSVRLKRDPGLPATIIRAPVYGEWGRA